MNAKSIVVSLSMCVTLCFGSASSFANPFNDAAAVYQLAQDYWLAGFNQKDMDLFMEAWSFDAATQAIDVNPENGALRISAGAKEIRNLISAYAAQRNPNEFQISHLVIQTDGDEASAFLKWEWGEWVDNLGQGTGNWGTARLVRENGEWRIHDVDFYSLVLKQVNPQAATDVTDLMGQVAQAYGQKNLLPLVPLIDNDHVYVDPAGETHRGAAATQAALAASLPEVNLDPAAIITAMNIAEETAQASQTQDDGRTIRFTWKVIDGTWKLIETDLSGKPPVESLAVEPQTKRLTTWGRVKQRK